MLVSIPILFMDFHGFFLPDQERILNALGIYLIVCSTLRNLDFK